jgi:hypothetical protein
MVPEKKKIKRHPKKILKISFDSIAGRYEQENKK